MFRRLAIIMLLCSMSLLITAGELFAQNATTNSDIVSQALASLNDSGINPEEGYSEFSPFPDNVKVEGVWALVSFQSFPSIRSDDTQMPRYVLVIGYWDDAWKFYVQHTQDYQLFVESGLENSPEWIKWLKTLDIAESVNAASMSVARIPALPFNYGEAWRFNRGASKSHSPQNSIDLGTYPRGNPGLVYAMDDGYFIGKSGTCVTFQNPTTAIQSFYQHINPQDINNWVLGSQVNIHTPIGYTTEQSGCDGYSTGHHVHINLRTDGANFSFEGSTLNDWLISDSSVITGDGTMSKGSVVVEENSATFDDLRNRVASSDPECPISMLSGVNLYTGYKCDGKSLSFTSPTGGTYLVSYGMNNTVNAVAVAPGWYTILYDEDPSHGNKTCFYGSITDLRNYYYPGSSMRIAGTPSTVEVYNQGICPEDMYPPVYSPMCSSLVVASSSTSDPCNPRDVTPPSASSFNVSVQNGSANLVPDGIIDYGGSGVQRVQFSAKWNGEWRVIGSKTSAPYSFTWNMCASGVPDTQLEFGLEVWDNAGNNFVWSQHANNPLANKSFNCNPSGGTTTGSIKLYSLANNGGSVVWSGETGFSNSPNANSYALSMPSGWSARVWRGDDRGGEMRCFSSSVPNLQDHGWHLAIQSIEGFNSNVCGDANTGLVVMCADGIGCWQFGAGYQPLAGFNMNDIMTSIQSVPSNMSVMLYREGRRRGTVECYNSPRNPLPSGWPWDLYKQATDAYVFTSQSCPSSQHGTVLFYSGKNHEGHIWSAGNEPGVVNMSDLGSREYFNDSAESMRIPPDKSVVIYADDNKGGEVSECMTGDRSDLGNFNNKVSSVEVFDNTFCKPSAPTNLTVIQTSPTSIWLAWNHPTMSDVAFKVYRWNGADFGFIAQTAVGSNSYLDEGLPCNSDQFYKLSAVTGRGESAQIGWIYAKTDLCQYPGEPVLHNGTGARTVLEGEPIIFAWDSAVNAVEYNAKLQGQKTYESGWQDGNQWVAYNVEPTIYIFQVTGRNQRGEGSSAIQFVYVKIAAPVIGAIDSETCSSNRIYWTDNSAYEEKFLVRRGGQIIAEVASVPTQNEYSYLDEGLSESGSYTYTIEAVSPGSGEGAYQNGFSQVKTGVVRKCPVAPVAVNLLSPANSTVFEEGQNITFSWDSGVADYYELNILQTGGSAQTIELGVTTHTLNNLPKGQYQWFVYSYTEVGKIGSVAGSFTVKEKAVPPPPTLHVYLPLIKK